jgi:CHAT domain-containing protein
MTALTLNHVGNVYKAQGKKADAIAAYQRAIATIETHRTQVAGGEQEQQRFFEGKLSSYYSMVELLIEQNKLSGAFAYAERTKARALLDVLHSGRVVVTKAMTETERERERALNNALVSLNTQIFRESQRKQPDATRLADLKTQLDKKRLEYEAFLTGLYAVHRDLQAQRGAAQPVTLTQLNQTLFVQQPNLCLLSYVVGENEILLFALTRGKNGQTSATLNAYRLPVKQKELSERVEKFRVLCATDGTVYKHHARTLYQQILAPAEKELTGKTHVVIVPDGVLHTMPFQALIDARGKHLIEKRAVSYAPSVTALTKMAELNVKRENVKRERDLVAFGRPSLQEGISDLPATEEEVKAIAKMFNTQPVIGKDATEARAKAEMDKARYVHFATHGLLNEASPMYSAVAFAKGDVNEDGLLHAQELVSMDLTAELVVLSACETAQGRIGKGEGIIGLTWALFVAGSPSSVVTQWKVSNESTSELMVEFYKRLQRKMEKTPSAIGKAEALRQAQLKLMKDGKHGHPFFWAPFVLIGDGR